MSSPSATTQIGSSAAIQTPEGLQERAGLNLLRLPLDPLLTLAVLGLGVCSVVTLNAATRHLIPGHPHYYVNRQVLYLR